MISLQKEKKRRKCWVEEMDVDLGVNKKNWGKYNQNALHEIIKESIK